MFALKSGRGGQERSEDRIATLENRIAELEKRLSPAGIDDALKVLGRRLSGDHPNMVHLNERFRDYEMSLLNVKQMAYYLGSLLVDRNLSRKVDKAPDDPLTSKLCTQSDVESDWCLFWCREIRSAPIYHRKLWELCFIAQALHARGKLAAGRRGLAFGCGEEPLPSLFAKYGASILGTDLAPDDAAGKGWMDTRQHATSLEKIQRRDICPDEGLLANIEHQFVDMNAIPEAFAEQFDFCWSACALEHVGSIEKGLAFVENSLKTLRPGGVAVHTTEFNLEDGETIDNWGTVLFQRRHLEGLAERLSGLGYQVSPLDFSTGSGVLDGFVDVPPFRREEHAVPGVRSSTHLKLSVDGFPCTSIGLIIGRS